MENKSEGNENRIILGDFNCTMDKIDREGGNKAQRRGCGLYMWFQLCPVKAHCGKWAPGPMEKIEPRFLSSTTTADPLA